MYGGVQNCDNVFKNASTAREREVFFSFGFYLYPGRNTTIERYITYSKKMYLKYTLGYCFLISSKKRKKLARYSLVQNKLEGIFYSNQRAWLQFKGAWSASYWCTVESGRSANNNSFNLYAVVVTSLYLARSLWVLKVKCAFVFFLTWL